MNDSNVNSHLFCIEDPFELTHDLGRVMDKDTLQEVRDEFERAHRLLTRDEATFATLCEKWTPPPAQKPEDLGLPPPPPPPPPPVGVGGAP